MQKQFIDITPTPRILRTLGEIPFAPWQCLAELIDNALDAFQKFDAGKESNSEKRIVISWSNESTATADQVLEVIDTGLGMEIEDLQNCVRAGYSSNNPVDNLGLFGMGFNISTARLGEKTLILSATPNSKEWIGIEIDFAELARARTFNAPMKHMPKRSPKEHGTRIIVSKLKPGIAATLRTSATQIRRTLEDVYTPLLKQTKVEIMVQSKILTPAPHCVWNEKRYVATRDETIPAIIHLNEAIGEALFDVEKNRYLTPDEEINIKQTTKRLPPNICTRKKMIVGWLGIQRYADPDDFGIDFIRNGRKLLIGDKTLFSYLNQLTGRSEIEYPIELGNTVGGRIVGEINIDHIPPTYQKNDFDRSDPSWVEAVEYLRGPGPILPNKRKAMGYDTPNLSPLARLISAYRRTDVGTRCLAAPHRQAREWAEKFRKGEVEYQTDEKWWKAAQEADRAKADKGAADAPAVDQGAIMSDDPGNYGPGTISGATISKTIPEQIKIDKETNNQSDLKARSIKNETFSGEYSYEGCRSPYNVTVWELVNGKIGSGEVGTPCAFFSDGNTCEFIFNPRHPFLASYPYTFSELLLMYLGEKFKVRDQKTDLVNLFVSLVQEKLSEKKIDHGRIQERAKAFFDRLRDQSIQLLAVREQEVIDSVHRSAGEVEEIVAKLTNQPDLLQKFQTRAVGSIDALTVAPSRTLIRLVEQYPEELLDEKFFRRAYMTINLPADKDATERLRNGSKERLLSYLRDALWILNDSNATVPPQRRKDELARCSHSLSFLEQETVV